MVRLEGAQEIILEKLTKSGFYKTQSEVIRAGILELAAKHRLFRNAQELEDELVIRKVAKISNKIDKGEIKTISWEEVKKKYGYKG